jgi:hypothetical protein
MMVKGSGNVLQNSSLLENCKLIATTMEAAEDYEVLQLGNSSLLAELSLSM